MFKLMDRVVDGISPMLDDLVDHILQAGLDDMLASADIITQVNKSCTISDRIMYMNLKILISLTVLLFS